MASKQVLDSSSGTIAGGTSFSWPVYGLERRPSLAELFGEEASLVAGGENLDDQVRVYPLGTAAALACIFQRIKEVN